MPRRSTQGRRVVQGEGETKQRILIAAAGQFSRASYDAVSLRDIATEVQVDVAYVHRCFGSKENLFRDVLELSSRLTGGFPAGPRAVSLEQLAATTESTHKSGDIEPLSILVQSAASHTAAPLIGERMQQDWIEPLSTLGADDAEFRAAMAMSLMMGFSLCRNLLQVPAMATVSPERARAILVAAVEHILAAPVEKTASEEPG